MAVYGSWGGSHRVALRNNETDEVRDFLTGRGAAFDPSSQRLAIYSDDHGMEVLDLHTGRLDSLPYEAGEIRNLDFNADGRRLVAGGHRSGIYVWDILHRKIIGSISTGRGPIFVACHPTNPHRFATGGVEGIVEIWDLAAGLDRPSRQFAKHTGAIQGITYSEDGRQLVTSSSGQAEVVLLWDAESGEIIQRFTGHTDTVFGVAISRDGRSVASAADDQTVRLWDATTGEETQRFLEHSGHTNHVYFTKDGRRLASSSSDGSIRFRSFLPSFDPSSLTQAEIEAQMGLVFRDGRIRPLPRRIEWEVEPTLAR